MKPYPWKCSECRERAVHWAVLDYEAALEHDGAAYSFSVPGLQVNRCERCGAIYARRTWRRGRALTHAALGRARWVVCPACRQTDDQQYVGRLLLQGSYVAAHEPAVRARIEHVVGRAQARQPERRLVSLERQRDGLEVLTTSQKLAHRVAHELRKAFGGRTTYAWSDDGSLLATWQRD